MATSKLDRRKKYTQMVLKDSFIKLLKEKDISSITVKEICELADINRSTFYSHFSDQFDLLDKLENEIIEDMTGYLSQHHHMNEDDDIQMLENLIEYFASKQEICKTLLNEKSDNAFQKKVMVFAHQFFKNSWIADNHLDEALSEYVSTFIISGSIHVINSWLNNGMNKSPKEMAEIINNLVKKGLLGMK
ncbi:TetR/AcrR family transcriptional regulator [Bacillus solitudinis]|uniref:TetR/AcrR family transcriptional regulator n=1 Tax=Bacillus solitudinis TaxID=2014074 RepID=UPI001D0CE3E4|nr:TetR/AcrR family transcriptional regulator [Bacillus solitudinis]